MQPTRAQGQLSRALVGSASTRRHQALCPIGFAEPYLAFVFSSFVSPLGLSCGLTTGSVMLSATYRLRRFRFIRSERASLIATPIASVSYLSKVSGILITNTSAQRRPVREVD